MALSYNRCFKAQEKPALPVMQQAKIENSKRDESRVDTKKWGGGGISHTRAKIPQKMPTGPE